MKKQKKPTLVEPAPAPTEAPPTDERDAGARQSEEDPLRGAAGGAAVGGLLGGAGDAAAGGVFGLIGGALGERGKKSSY